MWWFIGCAPDRSEWIEIDGARPDVAQVITAHGRTATARGFRPLVYLRPQWNQWLKAEAVAAPEVQHQLEGFSVLVVDLSDPRWVGPEFRCHPYHLAFATQDADGAIASPTAQPGTKEGPATSAEFADFLALYRVRLDRHPPRAIDGPEGVDCDHDVVPVWMWRERADG